MIKPLPRWSRNREENLNHSPEIESPPSEAADISLTLANKMEIYYNDNERIIANAMPAFYGRNKMPLTQIRITEEGLVTWRQFWTSPEEFRDGESNKFTISKDKVNQLISRTKQLARLSEASPLPIVDDTGSRSIDLNLRDGTFYSISFPNGGGRKHPARGLFDEVWSAIQTTTKSES